MKSFNKAHSLTETKTLLWPYDWQWQNAYKACTVL